MREDADHVLPWRRGEANREGSHAVAISAKADGASNGMPGLVAALLPAAARPSNELHLVEVAHRARSPCGERACQQCRLRPGIGRIFHDMNC
eukprot:1770531-Alexandrium_andersonii.AAC.1